jgi:hypothetical protein
MAVKGHRPGTIPPARSLAWLVAVALLGTMGRGEAVAHPEISPMGTNRFLSLFVLPGRIEVSDAFLHGALSGAEERRRLDADGDGLLSPPELEAGRTTWSYLASSMAVIEVDGRPSRLGYAATVDPGEDNRVGPSALVIDLRAWVEIPPGRHRVRVVLTRDPDRIHETEISIDLGRHLALEQSFRGGASDGDEGPSIKFEGPRADATEDRSATFVFAPAAPVAANVAAAGSVGRRALPLTATLLVLLTLGAVAVGWRVRRRR